MRLIGVGYLVLQRVSLVARFSDRWKEANELVEELEWILAS